MPPPQTPSLQRLAELASAAEIRELEHRKSVAAEIARLERERQFAYRRLDLAATTVKACLGAGTLDEALAAGAAALKQALGWNTETEPRKRVLEAWQPVVTALWTEARGSAIEGAASPQEALAAFEAWYEREFASHVLAHFDVELPELPVVEF